MTSPCLRGVIHFLQGTRKELQKWQKKRIRTNEAARMRNKAVKSELKTLTKHVQSAVAEGDAEKAQAALKTVTKRLDMAAAKHVIHKNQASNRKSGLAKLVNSINA